MECAFPEIKIDEVLIRHTEIYGERLEIGYSTFVQPNGDGLFQPRDVGVPFAFHLREIVVRPHDVTSYPFFVFSTNGVACPFAFIRFPRRQDSNHFFITSKAMAYNENAEPEAPAKHGKWVFILGVVGVEKPHCVLVEKYSLRLFKRQAMLAPVLPIFGLIPLEPQIIHMYNIHMFRRVGKPFFCLPMLLQRLLQIINCRSSFFVTRIIVHLHGIVPYLIQQGEVGAMINLAQRYLSSIRGKVCAFCLERTAEGTCGLSSPNVCPIEQFLPQIVDVVHSVEGNIMKNYVKALRTDVCGHCPNRDHAMCPFERSANCPLNRYFAIVVDAIDEVDEAARGQDTTREDGVLYKRETSKGA